MEATWTNVRKVWREAWYVTRDGWSLKLIHWALCVASPAISSRTLDLFSELAASIVNDAKDRRP